MNFTVNILKDIIIKPCPFCFGTGKLKAMQSVATNTGSVRGKDKEIKCKFCNGTGINKIDRNT